MIIGLKLFEMRKKSSIPGQFFGMQQFFINKGLSITPISPLVKNIGNDSYSTNLKGKTTINNKNFNNYAPKKHPKSYQ